MSNFEKVGILVIVGMVAVVLALACYTSGGEERGLEKEKELERAVENGEGENGIPVDLNLFATDLDLEGEAIGADAGDPSFIPPGEGANTQAGETLSPATEMHPPGNDRGDLYQVKKGDTLFMIARSYLGKGHLWPKIAEANPDMDPNKLHPGMQIKIPLRDDGAGSTPVLDVSGSEKKTAKPERSAPSGFFYTIQKGDTLIALSERFYGNKNRWRDILDANRDKIPNERNIRPGLRIRIR